MENLKQPAKRILINTLDYTQVGAYYDTQKGVNMLSFKQYGVNIPYVAGAFYGAKACSNYGAVTSKEIQLSNAAPCSSCNWNYGISLVKQVQYPGVDNDESNYNRKTYSGEIAAITETTPGVIDDKWLLQAEDDIISQIYADQGLHNQNEDPVTNSAAVAEARRTYSITVANAVTDSISITPYATGVTTTFALGASIAATCVIINGTAATNPYVRAIGIDATHILLQSVNNGDLFTIADGGGVTTIVVNYRRIWLTSKSTRVKFQVQYDLGFATIYARSQFVIDATAIAGTVNAGITINVNGTAHNIAENATIAGMTAAIVALAANGIYGTVVNTNYIYINGNSTVESMAIAYSLSPANYVTPGYTVATLLVPLAGFKPCTLGGSYPILTGYDLFRLMANASDQGVLAAWDNSDKPVPTDTYCAYFFRTQSIINAIHGASHKDVYESEVEVYVNTKVLATAFLLANQNGALSAQTLAAVNQAPTTTANIAFEALLQMWTGATVTAASGVMAGGSNPNAWTN